MLRIIDLEEELRRATDVGYETFVLPTSKNKANNVSLFRLAASATPNGYRNWKMAGVDKLRQRFQYEPSFDIGHADLAPEFEAVHGGTFTSLGQAIVEARSVLRKARWTQRAKMMCIGYRNVRPGRYVFVRDNEGEMGGFWYVTEVRHEVHNARNVSSSEITMCRVSRDLKPRPRAVPPARPPQVVLRSGQWQCDRYWRKVS